MTIKARTGRTSSTIPISPNLNAGDIGRPRFDAWVGMIPWRRNPIFLSWESPWTEEPGGLQSKGSRRVRHDWAQQHPQSNAEKPCFSIKKILITNECITLCWLKLRLKGYSHWNTFSWTIQYYSTWQFFFFHRKKINTHNTYSLMAIFSECLEDTEDMLWDIWKRTVQKLTWVTCYLRALSRPDCKHSFHYVWSRLCPSFQGPNSHAPLM